MPQMFPLLWLSLFFMSALLLLSMKSNIYFSSKPNPSSVGMKASKLEHNWKW